MGVKVFTIQVAVLRGLGFMVQVIGWVVDYVFGPTFTTLFSGRLIGTASWNPTLSYCGLAWNGYESEA